MLFQENNGVTATMQWSNNINAGGKKQLYRANQKSHRTKGMEEE